MAFYFGVKGMIWDLANFEIQVPPCLPPPPLWGLKFHYWALSKAAYADSETNVTDSLRPSLSRGAVD